MVPAASVAERERLPHGRQALLFHDAPGAWLMSRRGVLWLGYGFPAAGSTPLALVGLLVAYHWHCGVLPGLFAPEPTVAATSGSASITRCWCWCSLPSSSLVVLKPFDESLFRHQPRGWKPPGRRTDRPLRAANVQAVAGGVQFAGDWPVCYRANLESRIATRVPGFAKGPYTREEDVYRPGLAQRWLDRFALSRTISRSHHGHQVAAQIHRFSSPAGQGTRFCDRFRSHAGERPTPIPANGYPIHVYLTESASARFTSTPRVLPCGSGACARPRWRPP